LLLWLELGYTADLNPLPLTRIFYSERTKTGTAEDLARRRRGRPPLKTR